MADIVCFPPPPLPEVGFWANFLEFKLSDAINSVIALMSVLMAVLVYRYQKDKDSRDYAQQNSQQILAAAHQLEEKRRQNEQDERVARQEWIRLLLIEPNREYVLNFFRELEKGMDTLKHPPILDASKRLVRNTLEKALNEFEHRFLTYFESIDISASEENNILFDDLRDNLTNLVASADDNNYMQQHKELINLILKTRNTFLSNLYRFSFATN
ncbi:MAG: type II secretion system protein [Hymenobacter sp.]|nr:MAG: type II secretion system protein [Hymenobacter sp.]